MRLIDADALKDVLLSGIDEESGFYADLTRSLLEAFVDEQSTIDPVKHGKWKNKQMFDEELNPTIAFRHRCSECGFEICTVDETIWWHFCPNCGASMEA